MTVDWLNDDGIFLPMINDIARFNFYNSAIAKVANNKTFVDVGAGTGLLSYLAVKHGAKKVYAIERDYKRHRLLCSIIDKLGLNDKIEPMHADFLYLNLSADYCVTETIGTHIFDENILNIGRHAKSLGMTIIPEQMDLSFLVHKAHAIFFLSLKEHLQHTVRLENRINDFEKVLSDMININHAVPLNPNNYFPVSRALPEIIPEILYTSPPTSFIIGNDYENISLTLPAEFAELHAVVNIIWEAKFMNVTMDSQKTSWAVPAKRVVIPNKNMTFNYTTDRWWYNP